MKKANNRSLICALLVGLSLLLGACASTDNANKTSTDGKQTKADETTNKKVDNIALKEMSGLYFARLPCPNCGKVRVNLLLNENRTYDKTEEFLSSNEIFFENGTWAVKGNHITLTPTNNKAKTQSTIRHFVYKTGTLQLVRADGKPLPGKASDYAFRKK